jgi:tripartite-type tricarboxylate transporter receptor subunit TctC
MKLPRRQFLHLAAGAVALPAVAREASAQAFPTRPIRLVVPFPPGGVYDALGRPWADKMKPLLGTVIVENVGGAGGGIGGIGGAAVARARPDGPRDPCHQLGRREPAALRPQGHGVRFDLGKRHFRDRRAFRSAGFDA